jgi:hypothetical protein
MIDNSRPVSSISFDDLSSSHKEEYVDLNKYEDKDLRAKLKFKKSG